MMRVELENLVPEIKLSEAADCLKVMAHPVRLRVVDVLTMGDFTVQQLADICGLPQSQMCGHLRLMQNCGLLTSRRNGRSVYYQISSPQLSALIECVRTGCGQNTSEEQSL